MDKEDHRRRLLMLTHRAPFPPNRGDRIRAFHMLRELSTNWDVSLACLNDEPVEQYQWDVLGQYCEQVAIEEVGLTRWLRAASSAVKGKSLTEGLFRSAKLSSTIREWSNTSPFDCVLVYCSSMLQYVRDLEGTPVVADLVDVDSEKWKELSGKFRGSWRHWVYSMEATRVRELERQVVNRSAAVTLVSPEEAQLFRSEVSDVKPVIGIGNGVDVEHFTSVAASDQVKPDPIRIVFVGVLDYFPNVEGVTWFAEKVLPILRNELPCRLQLVGRRPNATVSRLAASAPEIELHADVPDVRDYLKQADIVIAPLQLARGIQNKVLEAMCCGLPVVLTQEAAVGVDGEDNTHFHIGQTPQEFAAHITRLAQSSDLRAQTGKAARQLIENKYSWASRLQPLVHLLEQVSQSHPIEVSAL